MALLLLTLTRSDLLDNWKTTLPANAPNRFLVNIQPDQRDALADFFKSAGLPAPVVYPMVRGRLTAINGKTIVFREYADERARRLIDREFNLSWAARPQQDNVIVEGRWWAEGERDLAQLSVESGIASTLGIHLGDELTYDVAGSVLKARVTSLRKVEWDSFRVNFFVMHLRGCSMACRSALSPASTCRPTVGLHESAGPGVSQFPRHRRCVHSRSHPEDDGPGRESRGVRLPVHARGRPCGALRGDQRDPGRAPV